MEKRDYIPENHSHATCVSLLIEAVADVNVKNEDGETALLDTVITHHDDCVDLLIEAGADVNQPCNDGRTPLKTAAFNGSTKN